MKITETRTKTQTYEVTLALVCDRCHTRYDGDSWGLDGVSHFATTTIASVRGSADRDGGGYTEVTSVDFCPACFTTTLLPWLRAQGIQLQTTMIAH